MNTLEIIVLVSAALGGLVYIVNVFAKLFKTWFKFVDDWNGTDTHPGVMERLEIGSDRFNQLESDLKTIKAELFNNHGTSLRDAIDRIERKLG